MFTNKKHKIKCFSQTLSAKKSQERGTSRNTLGSQMSLSHSSRLLVLSANKANTNKRLQNL